MAIGIGTVTGKGQVQVPKEIREAMGIATGDKLVFEVTGQGRITVTVRKRRPLSSLAGALAEAVFWSTCWPEGRAGLITAATAGVFPFLRW